MEALPASPALPRLRWRVRHSLAPRLAGALLGALLAAALWPARAAAGIDLTPWDGISPFDDILGGIGGAAADVVGKGFSYIINTLFGGVAAEVTTAMLSWLVEIPDLSNGSVGSFEETTAVIALALLSAVLTLSVIRFWFAGIGSGGGGMESLQGVGRAVAAVFLIVAWPTVFSLIGDATDTVSSALLRNDETRQNVGALLATGVGIGSLSAAGGGALPLFMGIIVAVAGMILLLGLVMMKILVTALTVILFVGMPLALVLWPLPETSWVAGMLAKALAAVSAIPVIWALVFGSFAALWSDSILITNNGRGERLGIVGSLADVALVKPLVALALLYLAIVVPKRLLAMAPMIGGRGGGGTLRYLGTSYAAQAAVPHLPGAGARALGDGARGLRAGGSAAAGAAAGSSGATAAVKPAAAAAAGAVSGGAAAPAAAMASAGGQAAVPVTSASVPAAGGAAASSAPSVPGGEQRRDRWGGPRQALTPERAEAISQRALAMREAPSAERPGPDRVQAAADSLPPALRRSTAELMGSSEVPQIRSSLAAYAEHPEGREHATALQAIGTADRRAWASVYGEGAGSSGQASGSQAEASADGPAPPSGAARSASSSAKPSAASPDAGPPSVAERTASAPRAEPPPAAQLGMESEEPTRRGPSPRTTTGSGAPAREADGDPRRGKGKDAGKPQREPRRQS